MTPITTRDELASLTRAPRPTRGRRTVEGEGEVEGVRRSLPGCVAPSPPVWTIPGPRGSAYTRAEAAEAVGVPAPTIGNWISRGRRAEGRLVRLRTLRAPRGRIAPQALCQFLGAVNGLRVEVRTEMQGGCDG